MRGEQSEALLDVRMRCLDDRRRALGALATVLGSRGDPTTRTHAIAAAGSLPAIRDCDAVETLAAVHAPSPGARLAIAAATTTLYEAEALGRAGHFAEALGMARAAAAPRRRSATARSTPVAGW